MKRLFDIGFSAAGLAFLFPLFLLIALLIRIDGKGPVFFRQERIGKGFRPFRIFKFRTMRVDLSGKSPLITVGDDRRVTCIGKVLRRTKLDELPQLINILRGEMSFVGPRPEVKKYVDLFRTDYEKLLTVRPGITDPASILFSDEGEVLARSKDWEKEYICRVLPEKIRLASGYVDKHNVFIDVRLIMKTLIKMISKKTVSDRG